MPRIYPKFSVVRSYPGLQTAAAELRTQVPGCKRISAALHISLGKASAWKQGKGLPGPEELAKLEEMYGALPATRAALEGYEAWRQARRHARPRGKDLARELIRKIERAQKRGATVQDEDDAAALALIDYFVTYAKSYVAALNTLDTYVGVKTPSLQVIEPAGESEITYVPAWGERDERAFRSTPHPPATP